LYYSSLVYQLIENQDKALAEAFRVLKPGGIEIYNWLGKFGIVIWGSRENCTALNLLSDALVEAGLIPLNPHSGYLDDKNVIIEKVKKHGFVNIRKLH
jgi:ubiquinone/menaquinone biosynthesis C-methylase UbiE